MSQQHYIETGFPVVIGGTKIENDTRVMGPPSRMIPTLRDLAKGTVKLSPSMGGEVKPRVMIELDLPVNRGRKEGIITGLSNRPGSDEVLVFRTVSGQGGAQSVKLTDILAFRVLKVEVPEPDVVSR